MYIDPSSWRSLEYDAASIPCWFQKTNYPSPAPFPNAEVAGSGLTMERFNAHYDRHLAPNATSSLGTNQGEGDPYFLHLYRVSLVIDVIFVSFHLGTGR